MALEATKREYKSAFTKHYHAYTNWGNAGSDNSKRLILVYCVECGLKYLLMDKVKVNKVSEAEESIQEYFRSHDFYLLLQKLNNAGGYRFGDIHTQNGEVVRPKTYHQLCRYVILTNKADIPTILSYDNQLKSISEWLYEQVN